MTLSTMQDFPLTITAILRHGRRVYADSECVTWTDAGARRATFAEVADNADRLAAALTKLGVGDGDRVGTFCWNTQEHLEAYFAIPCIGAVLHTLNIRLFPEQLAYVINHAEDRVVIVDDSLIPVLARVVDDLETVETFIVVGDGDASALGDREVLRYHELLAAEAPGFDYPELDERQAAAMCYTSGTTGNPKGVAYSHRSSYLHSLVATTPDRARTLRARSRAHDRADVPRERVGHPVRRVHLWCVRRDAGPFPAGRTADDDDRGRARARSPARCRRSGPTSCATATSTRSTCRRCA